MLAVVFLLFFKRGHSCNQENKLQGDMGFLGGSAVKNPPAIQELQETKVPSLGWKDPLGEGMATHSSILAWRSDGQRSLAGYSHTELDTNEVT